jgi:hypothetical protein
MCCWKGSCKRQLPADEGKGEPGEAKMRGVLPPSSNSCRCKKEQAPRPFFAEAQSLGFWGDIRMSDSAVFPIHR